MEIPWRSHRRLKPGRSNRDGLVVAVASWA